MTLESDTLDTSLVLLLATAYFVEVWCEGDKVMYRLSKKPGIKRSDNQ